MVTGGIVIVLTSVFFNGTALPMVATIMICSLIALTLAIATLRPRALAAQPAE
jgi:DHA1 family bicyclomycin/chloramphenicol resistance-like MFS transporter